MMKTLGLVVACMLVVMSLGPVAMAQDSVREGYDESGVLGEIDEGTGPADRAGEAPGEDSGTLGTENAAVAADAAGEDSLPFTGLDVAILLVMGGALVATGVAVRRGIRSTA
jgi:hypothetical protein